MNSDVEILIEVSPTSVSVPAEKFVSVPPDGLPGQFLAFDNTWRYPDASASTITKKAQGALSGHRVVFSFSQTHVSYASQSNYLQVRAVLGITTGAASDGDDVVIQDKGAIIEPGWSWLPGDVWLSNNGQLTQVLPTGNYLFRVGSALAPTVLQLDFQFIAQLS